MKVAKITKDKAQDIKGKSYGYGVFNPIQDKNNNWVISLLESKYIEEFEIIDFEPVILESDFLTNINFNKND